MPYLGVQPTAELASTADLSDNIITTAKINADAVTAAKIADDAMAHLSGYVCGNHYKSDNIEAIPLELRKVVYSFELQQLFNELCENIICQDVMMTHEYKNEEVARNNWLHFDRLRCWKAVVYLTDVEEGCGPFSVIPQSHKTGHQLRQAFINAPSYDEKKNSNIYTKFDCLNWNCLCRRRYRR